MYFKVMFTMLSFRHNVVIHFMVTTLSTFWNLIKLLKQLQTLIEVLRNFKLIFWLITFLGKVRSSNI